MPPAPNATSRQTVSLSTCASRLGGGLPVVAGRAGSLLGVVEQTRLGDRLPADVPLREAMLVLGSRVTIQSGQSPPIR